MAEKNHNMKKIILSIVLISIFTIVLSQTQNQGLYTPEVYGVTKTKKPIKIDANWDKKEWKNVKPISITNYMGTVPDFKPETQVKMAYDKEYIYVIFKVNDKFVRCITNRINGPVFRDSAVEFFFSPDTEKPLLYFNIETNCGGTALFHYNLVPRRESKRLSEEEIKQVEIAHSLPEIIDPEITEEVTWTIEYKVPIALLQKYSNVTAPAKGIEWKANFYKIAEISSNPHYITWSKIDKPRPDFHVPEEFGRIIFK